MKQQFLMALVTVLALALWSGGAWAGPVANNTVPEPSSLSLLAVAIGGAAWAKFRRRK